MPIETRAGDKPHEPIQLDEVDPDFIDTTESLGIHPETSRFWAALPGPLKRVLKNLTIGNTWFYVALLTFFIVRDIWIFFRTGHYDVWTLILLFFLVRHIARPFGGMSNVWYVLPGSVVVRGQTNQLCSRRDSVLVIRQEPLGRWRARAICLAHAAVRVRVLTRIEAMVLLNGWMSRADVLQAERMTDILN